MSIGNTAAMWIGKICVIASVFSGLTTTRFLSALMTREELTKSSYLKQNSDNDSKTSCERQRPRQGSRTGRSHRERTKVESFDFAASAVFGLLRFSLVSSCTYLIRQVSVFSRIPPGA